MTWGWLEPSWGDSRGKFTLPCCPHRQSKTGSDVIEIAQKSLSQCEWGCGRLAAHRYIIFYIIRSTLVKASTFVGGRSGTCTAPRLCLRWVIWALRRWINCNHILVFNWCYYLFTSHDVGVFWAALLLALLSYTWINEGRYSSLLNSLSCWFFSYCDTDAEFCAWLINFN